MQYWHWLTAALHGDLGESIALRESVSTLIRERVGVTLELVLYASVADPAARDRARACSPALRRGPVDTAVIAGTTVSAAMPSFVAAIVLISVFAVKLRLVPGARRRHGLRSTGSGT